MERLISRNGEVVVGLDLAGVETRPTGLCLLRNLRAETALVYTDDEIVDRVTAAQPALITVDAPLSLPPGRHSLADRNGEHLRSCDRELLRRGIRFFPVTLGPMRLLTERGMGLAVRLRAQGLRIEEAYPGGAQDVWGIPRKKQGVEKLRCGLMGLGVRGLDEPRSDHELDAVTAALVGAAFLAGRAEAYGDSAEGVIVMPRPRA